MFAAEMSSSTADEIKTQLADMRGIKVPGLEFDDQVTAQLQVVKQQVEVKILPAYFQRHLFADKGEARAQLQQELADVLG